MTDVITVSLDPITVIFGASLVGVGSGIGTSIGKELYEDHIKSRAKRLFNDIAKNGR